MNFNGIISPQVDDLVCKVLEGLEVMKFHSSQRFFGRAPSSRGQLPPCLPICPFDRKKKNLKPDTSGNGRVTNLLRSAPSLPPFIPSPTHSANFPRRLRRCIGLVFFLFHDLCFLFCVLCCISHLIVQKLFFCMQHGIVHHLNVKTVY